MTYLNQLHKEASERKMRKIAEWEKTPLSAEEMVRYMFMRWLFVVDAEIKRNE